MANDHLGPALRAASLRDAGTLRDLFAEQRARLQVVREHRLWHWFGGVPNGFGSPRAALHGLYLQGAFVLLLVAAIFTAGFTYGIALWSMLGAAFACLLAKSLLLGPPTRRTLQLYARAVPWAGIVVAHDARLADPGDEEERAAVVLATLADPDGQRLPRLVAAAARVRAWLAGSEAPPAACVPSVQAIRDAIAAGRGDGSRVRAPAELGDAAFAIAFVRLSRYHVPQQEVTSRLLFGIADPERSDEGSTRVTHCTLWGNGVEALAAELPLAGA
jgi:hypothetical protein